MPLNKARCKTGFLLPFGLATGEASTGGQYGIYSVESEWQYALISRIAGFELGSDLHAAHNYILRTAGSDSVCGGHGSRHERMLENLEAAADDVESKRGNPKSSRAGDAAC